MLWPVPLTRVLRVDDEYCALCGAVLYNPIFDNEVDSEHEDEEYEYDRSVIRLEDADWLSDCRVLGFNTDSPSVEKYMAP